jgi:hypothetical protein
MVELEGSQGSGPVASGCYEGSESHMRYGGDGCSPHVAVDIPVSSSTSEG